ncbi:MAG: hypothetical protein ABL940_11435 [Bacteroidia bacterium]
MCKNSFLIIISLILFSNATKAQRWYTHAMAANMLIIDSTQNAEIAKNSGEVFKRIYKIKPNDWHALYYLVLCKAKANMLYKQKYTTKKTPKKQTLKILDDLQHKFDNEITPYLIALDTLKNDSNEVMLLKAYVHLSSAKNKNDTAKINLCMRYLNLAKNNVTNNPRVEVMEFLLYTFLQNANEQKLNGLKKTALLKFSNETPHEKYYPAWGYYYVCN